jgi:hypothetical protein
VLRSSTHGPSGYGRQHGRGHAGVTVFGVALVLGLSVWAAYLFGASTAAGTIPPDSPGLEAAPAAPTAPPASRTAPTTAPLPTLARAEPSTDPVESAAAWLSAYRSVRYDDPTPMAWLDRVRPVVTQRLGTEYEGYRDGSIGAGWEEFGRQRCSAAVEDAGGVIPREAPRTRTTVHVQIAGTLHTRCQDPTAAQRPVEDLAATLKLVRGGDGLWRVDRRLY